MILHFRQNTIFYNWWQSNRHLDLFFFFFIITLLYFIIGTAFALLQGLICFFGALAILMKSSRQRLILLDVLPVLAILQLWVAPAAWYHLEASQSPENLFYLMPVSADIYFSITIPCILAIGLGSQIPLFFCKKPDMGIVTAIQQKLQTQPLLPVALLVLGFIGFWLERTVAMEIRQVCHYLSQLIWVGGLHLLFLNGYRIIRTILLVIMVAFGFGVALESTMFSHFVFWMFFGVLYLQLTWQWKLHRLIFLFFIGILFLFTLFTFKYYYRGMAEKSGGNTLDKAALFAQAFAKSLAQPLNISGMHGPFYRLNQGYYLALVYAHVPANQSFVNGETVQEAIWSALIPRLFWRDKPMAGGHVNFPRFTGRALEENTSTNISPVGDGYVNYGARGAILFLFIYAVLLRLLFEGYRWLAENWYAPILLWLPLIFMTGVSVEGDILTVWNDAVKGSFFILLGCGILYWLEKNIKFSIKSLHVS